LDCYQRQRERAQGSPPAVASPRSPGLDASVDAFKRLCELNPKQRALTAQLDRGTISDADHEELDFLTDEIERLIEILEKHGFPVPGCARLTCAAVLLCIRCWRSYLVNCTSLRTKRKHHWTISKPGASNR
jgi:hypothetical protein